MTRRRKTVIISYSIILHFALAFYIIILHFVLFVLIENTDIINSIKLNTQLCYASHVQSHMHGWLD